MGRAIPLQEKTYLLKSSQRSQYAAWHKSNFFFFFLLGLLRPLLPIQIVLCATDIGQTKSDLTVPFLRQARSCGLWANGRSW